ncbi:hypothetical protein FPV67DRAFT_1415762 [Lyophyllum atratum]|nr:hypothetical protein FPV67DRAFT_1415762 [Lyophyllum atratum]
MSTATTFLATALAIGLPWAYSLRRSSLSWSTVVSLLLLVHSLAGLHTLLLRSPPNIFRAFQIPLNTPTDAIRALLIRQSDTPELNPELDGLLRRLASFDVRTLYPRFGHNVLATCTYCHSFEDFAVYALPRAVMSYIREVAFVGLITTRRRKIAVTALFLMALLEFYTLATVEIKIPLRGSNQPVMIWWHDVLLYIRHTIFIILPLLIHFVPSFRIPFISGPTPAPNVDTTALLMQTHQTMAHLLPVLHFVKYAHAATMRVPELRERASAWWEEEARVGAWIRGDGEQRDGEQSSSTSVRGVARGLGVSFDEAGEGVEEGKLRASAKIMTKVLINDSLKPSDHWHRL